MRLQIYLSEKKDQEIINYIKKQEDYSKYVRRLILQDMSNDYPLTKEDIIKIIQDYTKNSNNVIGNKSIEDIFG